MAGGRGPGSYGPMRTPFLSEEEKENQPSVTPALLKRMVRGCGQKVGLNFPHRICEKCIQKNSTIKHLKSMKKQNL